MPWPMRNIARISIAQARSGQIAAQRQTALLLEMLQENTRLTVAIRSLTERVATLTNEVHHSVVKPAGP